MYVYLYVYFLNIQIMKNPEVTTAIVLEKRFPRKDGSFPIKIRVTYNREQKYYATKLAATENEFKKINSAKARGDFKDKQILLNAIEQKARDIIESLPEFSFEAFQSLFLGNKLQAKKRSITEGYDEYIYRLKENGQVGTANMYELSKKSLQTFSKTQKLTFKRVTVDFLEDYEKYMLNEGKSPTTVGMYLRCLRKIFNDALAEEIITQKDYPFGRNKYVIPAGKNIKKAFSAEELSKFMAYGPIPETSEGFAKDMWFFSFLANGMNMSDIFRLKYKNIDGDKIVFHRQKTKRTTKSNAKPIVVVISEPLKAIIDRWKQTKISGETYLLPFLNDEMSEERKISVIKSKTKLINKFIKRIAENVEIDKNITTYYARHSFSTRLKQLGASNEFISESIGHSDVRTTENYLDSFEDGIKKDFANKLFDFNN